MRFQISFAITLISVGFLILLKALSVLTTSCCVSKLGVISLLIIIITTNMSLQYQLFHCLYLTNKIF